MKTLKSFFLLLSVLTMVNSVYSRESADLANRLDKVISRGSLSRDNFNIWVGKAMSGDEIFSVNAKKLCVPASLSKLATAAAVLNELPSDFRAKTELWLDGEQKGSELKGDLILKGGGDPAFVSENLWFLVNAFVREGIKVIEGDLLVDESYFEGPVFDSSRESVRVDRAYDAPVSAMSFNWNSVNIFVRPADKVGKAAVVFADPESDYIKVINKSETVGENKKTTIEVSRLNPKDHYGDVIEVSGQIPLGQNEIVVYKNITKPALWSGANLKAFLSQRGISVKGQVKVGKLPAKARKVIEVPSKSVENLVTDMEKFSNNFVAEMLTKNLGAMESIPGTMSKGMTRITDFLTKKIGFTAGSFTLESPSGFSRDNRMTPEQLGKILVYMRKNFPVAAEYMTALPLAGRDGTLKKRMKGTKAERWVRAKTGYLNGVVGLSGYIGKKDGEDIAFVFIYNGKTSYDQSARELFDQMAITIVE